MKNIRGAKALGMKTCLVLEAKTGAGDQVTEQPDETDPCVDVVVQRAGDIKNAIPGLWKKEWRTH